MASFFCFMSKDAEEFFERCMMAEAVTEKERLEILKNMADEGKIFLSGEINSETGKALLQFFEKTKHKGILMLRQKGKSDNEAE